MAQNFTTTVSLSVAYTVYAAPTAARFLDKMSDLLLNVLL